MEFIASAKSRGIPFILLYVFMCGHSAFGQTELPPAAEEPKVATLLHCPSREVGQNYTFIAELYNVLLASSGSLTTLNVNIYGLPSVLTVTKNCRSEECPLVTSPGVEAKIGHFYTSAESKYSIFTLEVTLPFALLAENQIEGIQSRWAEGEMAVGALCNPKTRSGLDFECSENPDICLNGGICTSDPQLDYTCECPAGYIGYQCQAGDNLFHCQSEQLRHNVNKFQAACKRFEYGCYTAGVDWQELVSVTYMPSEGESPFVEIMTDTQLDTVIFDICVTDELTNGQYQYRFLVGNARVEDFLIFNITVDVSRGDQPRKFFNADFYKFTISGSLMLKPGRFLVAVNVSEVSTCVEGTVCIEIIHPDVNSVSLVVNRVSSLDNIEFRSEKIPGVSLGSFYLAKEFTGPDEHLFTLMAIQSSTTATATVTFKVTENKVDPVCSAESHNETVDRFLPVTAPILRPDCGQSQSLKYTIKDSTFSTYFRVNDQTGEVTLSKSLEAVDVDSITFTLEVSDGAGATQLSVWIIINGAPVTECSISEVRLPDTWIAQSKVNVEVLCSPETIAYDFTLVPQLQIVFDIANVNGEDGEVIKDPQPFDFENYLMYSVELRFSNFVRGHYELGLQRVYAGEVTSYNGEEVGEPLYFNLTVFNPPVFTVPSFELSVEETWSQDESNLRLTASTDTPDAQLVFTIIEQDPISDVFGILGQDGTVIVQPGLDLRNYRDQTFIFTVQVEDTVSKLTSRATVRITVQDVDEPTVCEWKSKQAIPWDAESGYVVNQLVCTDPDTKPDFIGSVRFETVNMTTDFEFEQSGTLTLLAPLTQSSNGDVLEIKVTEVDNKQVQYPQFFTIEVASPVVPKPEILSITVGDYWVQIESNFDLVFVQKTKQAGWVIDYSFFCMEYPNYHVILHETSFFYRNVTPNTTYLNCLLQAHNGWNDETKESTYLSFHTRETPRVEIYPSSSIMFMVGDEFRLDCVLVPSNWSDVEFRWTGPVETNLTTESRLQFQVKSDTRSGAYTCVVTYGVRQLPSTIGATVDVFIAGATFTVHHNLDTELEWTDALDDPNSAASAVLKFSLAGRIRNILSRRTQFIDCWINSFRRTRLSSEETGRLARQADSTLFSVSSQVTIVEGVAKQGDTTDVLDVLTEAVSRGDLMNETISKLDDTLGNLKITTDMISWSSEGIHEGTNGTISASFWAVLSEPPNVYSTWHLNDRRLFTDSSTHFTVSYYFYEVSLPQEYILDEDVTAYVINISLRITNIQRKHIGGYKCSLTLPGNHSSWLSLDLNDIPFYPAQELHLSPLVQYVQKGGKAVVICSFSSNLRSGDIKTIENEGSVVLSERLGGLQATIEVTRNLHVVCTAKGDHMEDVTSNIVKVFLKEEGVEECPELTDENGGVTWLSAPVGTQLVIECVEPHTGIAKRNCTAGGIWGRIDLSQCVHRNILNLTEVVDDVESGLQGVDVLPVVGVELVSSLNRSDVSTGDITASTDILEEVADIAEDEKRDPVNSQTLKEFIKVTNLILTVDSSQPRQVEPGDYLSAPTSRVLLAMDRLSEASLRREDDLLTEPLVTDNLVVQQGDATQSGIDFPSESVNYTQDWVRESGVSVHLDKDAITTSDYTYSIIVYRSVEDRFVTSSWLQKKYRSEQSLGGKRVASEVISVTIRPHPPDKLEKPLELTFRSFNTSLFAPVCTFMDASVSEYGLWSTEGCRTVLLDSGGVQCLCDHLTNFAILMSPYGASSSHDDVLDIISIVGCCISIFLLVVTIIVYIWLWKYVKSDRSKLHMHLAVCLILAYATFLVGVDRTESDVGCTVVAALLHFLFLVVFFLMLAEAIEIVVTVTMVFEHKSLLAKVLLMSYGVPLIIVGVTLGITQADDYHSDNFCWLSVDSGVFWAFAGPALTILLVNYIIIIIIVKTMLSTSTMMTKTAREKTKSVVKAIAVLSPLLGVTWLFGVLSVNEDTVAFQYIFAILNSLQGLFIFIFYVVFCHQVRDGYRARHRRYRARSFDSGQQKLASSSNKMYSESDSNSKSHPRKDSNSSLGIPSTPVTQQTMAYSFGNVSYQEEESEGPRIYDTIEDPGPRHQAPMIMVDPRVDYPQDPMYENAAPGGASARPDHGHLAPPDEENFRKRPSLRDRLRGFVRQFSSKKRNKHERDIDRLKDVYGYDVNAGRAGQNGTNDQPSHVKKNDQPLNLSQIRWRKVQDYTHSPHNAQWHQRFGSPHSTSSYGSGNSINITSDRGRGENNPVLSRRSDYVC